MIIDVAIAPLWLIANGLLFRGTWQISRRLFPGDCWYQHVGHATLMTYATFVLVGTLIGSIGAVHPWLFLAIITGVGLSSVMFIRVNRISLLASQPLMTNIKSPIHITRHLCNISIFVWGFIGSLWLSNVILNGLLCFPSDWDTMAYHLPFVDHWLQAQNLYVPDCRNWSNPGNNEVFTLWLVGPFSGDFLYSLTNVPAAIFMTYGAIEIGTWLGLSVFFRHLAAIAVVTNHVVWKQLTDVENDVATAGLLLVCLGYSLRFSECSRRADLALCSVALGLLGGVKYYALGYAAVAVAIVTYLLFRRGDRRRFICAAMVSLSMLSGYWYLRNMFATGTPLFPLGAKTEGEALAETYPDLWQSTLVGNGAPELFHLLLQAIWDMSGPCHWLAFLCLPLSLVWLPLSCIRQGALSTTRRSRQFLTLGILAALSVWLVTPFAVEDVPGTLNQMHWKYCPVRYGLCPLSLAVLGFFVVATDFAAGIYRLTKCMLAPFGIRATAVHVWNAPAGTFKLILILCAGYQWFNQFQIINGAFLFDLLLLTLCFILFVINCVLLVRLEFSQVKGLRLLLILSVFIFICFFIGWLSNRWHAGFANYYDRKLVGMFSYISTAYPPGSVVCVLEDRSYPFYGSFRQFNVTYVTSTKGAEWWAEYINRINPQLVAIGVGMHSDRKRWNGIQKAIESRPNLYEIISDHSCWYIIYQINHN